MGFPVLMDQQAAASQFIQTRPYAGVFLDMSGGKSLATLHALSKIQPAGHVLIIAPIKIARLSWISEIEKWGVNVRARSLIVDEKDRKLSREQRLSRYAELLDPKTPPTLWFINQELIYDLVTWLPPLDPHDRKKIPTPRWPFPTVIIDESQGFKSASSQRFKAVRAARGQISRMILLSGTPAPNSLEDLWSQVYLLDMGQALGPTMTQYRMTYFESKIRLANGTQVNWQPCLGAKEAIYQRIDHLVMSAPTVARKPIPPMTFHNIMVDMSNNSRQAYRTLANTLVLDIAQSAGIDPQADRTLSSVSATNKAVLRTKLVQLASGTIYLDDTEDVETEEELQQFGVRIDVSMLPTASQSLTAPNGRQYAIVHNAKVTALLHLLRQQDSPVLIAYYFTCDRDIITNYLMFHGYDVRVFDGTRDMYEAWNRGEIQVMLIHPASAGHGLNLQDGGHTLVWYTLPASLEHYMQTNKRLHRVGQQHPVNVYQILTRGTIDEKLPGALEKKEHLQQSLIDAVEKTVEDIMT